MANSYVPQGTTVVCTNMTNGVPIKIGIVGTASILHQEQPLLNINDKKLSASFECKIPAKFWGGLEALCFGIAVAALIIVTGGVAAAAIITAYIVASVVAVAAGVTALYKIAHDCDASLQGEWSPFHKTVKIDKANAILNHSILTCPKGGAISIIINPVIAIAAAKQISDNNKDEVYIDMGAQFAIGALTVATGGSAAAVAALCTIGLYIPLNLGAEKIEEAMGGGKKAIETTDTGTAVVADAVTGGESIKTLGQLGKAAKGLIQYGSSDIAESFEGALRYIVASKAFKGGAIGLGGFVGNLGIGIFADSWMDSLSEETGRFIQTERKKE